MKLYHHKTDGGAEYLTDTFITWKHNGKSGKEGTVTDETRIIVRIDGDITKDAEITIRNSAPALEAENAKLRAALELAERELTEIDEKATIRFDRDFSEVDAEVLKAARAALAQSRGQE